ncbi:MAG: amino acid adenylation domain-containing protein, partial [Acidobacteriota bacterium]
MQQQTINGFQLSPQQRRLWLLQQSSPIYCVQYAIALTGCLNAENLKMALQQAINRQDILRTTFHRLPGMELPIQVVAESGQLDWRVVDLSRILGEKQTATVKELFSPDTGLLSTSDQILQLCATLLILGSDKYILFVYLPSLCVDSHSAKNLIQEISCCYAACLTGNELVDKPMPYIQFSEWQNELLEDETAQQGREYWNRQSPLTSLTLKLAFEKDILEEKQFQTKRLTFEINPELVARLEPVAKNFNSSVEILLLSCWQVLLWRLTGQENIVIGSDFDPRDYYEELEGALGLFTKRLPIHCRLDNDLSFDEVLRQVDTAVRDAQEWQEFFELPRRENGTDSNGLVFFAVGFGFEERPVDYYNAGVSFSLYDRYACTEHFKIDLCCVKIDYSLITEFYYDARLFPEEEIGRLAGQFHKLLESAINNPQAYISDLAVLNDTERVRLLIDFNQTAVDYPNHFCLHQLFEDQVEKTPDNLAVAFREQELSYRELNSRANQLAHLLCDAGVRRETLVGVCLERSIEMVIGLIAILKTGSAYVPLDPSYPRERLAFMLADTKVPLLLTKQRFIDILPTSTAQVICLDSDWEMAAEKCEFNINTEVTTDNLAYVIYTSGSTGKPKGVMISHQAICNRMLWAQDVYQLGETDRVLQSAAFNFDFSVWEIFAPLLVGAGLILALPEGSGDNRYLVDLIAQRQVSIVHFVPSMLRMFLEQPELEKCNSLRYVFSGGEPLSLELQERFFNHLSAKLYNQYGPTEAAVDVTFWACRRDTNRRNVPIGQPIANTQIYLLDNHLEPVPVGAPGELYISGTGLARGYFNRPDLTADSFIANPFGEQAGARMYRSGDFARYLPDGNIEYLGRVDHQVKVRGYRIELGEIEELLRSHLSVADVVVMAREDEPAEKRLVAYIVVKSGNKPTVTDLRNYLKDKLPDYMVPSAFVILNVLPLLPSGKVDRSMLPAPISERPNLARAYVVPHTPTEEMLTDIWSQVLGIERIGIHDNFFELGGHSLLATQVVSRVRETFRIELPLRVLFESQTIAELATSIEAISQENQGLVSPTIVPIARDRDLPLSFAQQRLWFLDQLVPNSPFYNIHMALRLSGSLNVVALQRALDEIVRRHEVLRTIFPSFNGQPKQIINKAAPINLPLIDLQKVFLDKREEEAQRLATEEARQPFNLAMGPLFRVKLVQLNEEEYLLLSTMHHIVSDGWSTGVFINEFSQLYRSFNTGYHSPLPQLPVQYSDFAYWQREWLQGEVLQRQLTYWRQQLTGVSPALELPTDRPRPAIQTYQGARDFFLLPTDLSQAIKNLSRQEGVTIFMTLLAAFQTLLYRYTGQEDICVGTPIANRNRFEIEGLIGFFINTLVLRTIVNSKITFKDLLEHVREVALGAYAHQDIPFEQLVEELQPARDMSRSPLFQVMFALQNVPISELQLEGLRLSGLQVEAITAKFDMTFNLVDSEQGLFVRVEYNTDLFEAITIQRMIGHFETLLGSIVAEPTTAICALPML